MVTKILTLPLPSRVLSPNARPNRFAKTAAVRIARTTARREAYLLRKELDFPFGFVVVALQFHAYWKTTRGKNDDINLLASCKAYEDGIQDAMRQDDSTWSIEQPVHGHDPDNPRLEIHIRIQPL